VRAVLNYYQTITPAWRAKAVPGPGFKGSINNVNLDKQTDVTHFNIEKLGRLQDQAISRIAALTGSGRAIATGAPVSADGFAQPGRVSHLGQFSGHFGTGDKEWE